MCVCVPPVVGPSDVVMVVEVVVRSQQVSDSQTISVLQGHVRTQTITTDRKRKMVRERLQFVLCPPSSDCTEGKEKTYM